MAYENEVRPAPRTDTYVERTSTDSSTNYALPVIALLIVLGGGLWFFSTRDSGPTPVPTTIERTTVPTPAPSPTVPAPAPSPTIPAPTPPK